MKLIVGLGNPGKEYINTRHNIGFQFIDYYLNYKNINDTWSKKFDGLYIQTNIGKEKVIFLKPQTYMNLSGVAVSALVKQLKLPLKQLCIIYDDIIDTGGTIIKAANYLKEKGAKKIYIAATHGLFSKGFDIFEKAESVDLVCVSDSIPTVKNIKSKKLKIISLENMISKAIDVD